MSINVNAFTVKIFDYINSEYGNNILKIVKSDNNKQIISRITESSFRQNDAVSHAANKIIAMLKVNPK